MLTTAFIQSRLNEVAADRQVRVRYACESGSRAWGLASTDSDYDVRFIYQHPREWYLQLVSPKDMIGPVMELGGELDLAGWDLRKLLAHLAGSNAGILEWLHSPVTYHLEDDFLASLRELAAIYFQPSKVAAHYLGIARSAEKAGHDEAVGSWNLKKYFYFIRPVLAARFVIDERRVSPVPFNSLLEQIDNAAVRSAVDDLVAFKQTVSESHQMKLPTEVETYFRSLFETNAVDLQNVLRKEIDRKEINAFFRETVGY